MALQKVLATLNEMLVDGIIHRYAIGGAVGATFYLEPVATVDLDVFVTGHPESGASLLSLEPIYKYLAARGVETQGEYVVIEGWPVQFLVSGSPLTDDALEQAIEFEVEGETVRVFTAEHLAAIALEVGRPKDKARLLQFLDAAVVDLERFESILEKHDLSERWLRFKQQFLSGAP